MVRKLIEKLCMAGGLLAMIGGTAQHNYCSAQYHEVVSPEVKIALDTQDQIMRLTLDNVDSFNSKTGEFAEPAMESRYKQLLTAYAKMLQNTDVVDGLEQRQYFMGLMHDGHVIALLGFGFLAGGGLMLAKRKTEDVFWERIDKS